MTRDTAPVSGVLLLDIVKLYDFFSNEIQYNSKERKTCLDSADWKEWNFFSIPFSDLPSTFS